MQPLWKTKKNIICIEIDDMFMVTVITLLRGKSNSLGSD